jgi:uncharacterized cupin superfamily protein
VIPESGYEKAENGIVPKGEGWFVVNAREAAWRDSDFGAYTRFEGDVHFPQIGINISVLAPGQPSCMYHGEDEQEDFLVLSGQCLLLVEGQERLLEAWDFVHCPAWTEHVFVGAGDGPCTLLAIGGRSDGDVIYPEAEVAQRHGAGVEKTTKEPKEAYAGYSNDVPARFRDEWLPG